MSFLQITFGRFYELLNLIFELSLTWIPCPPGHFLQYSEWGIRGQNTPKSTPKKSQFLCIHFWPTLSAPTKILALTEFVGGPAPYPMVKRARGYLPPVRRYGIPNIWHNIGVGPVSTKKNARDWLHAWWRPLGRCLRVQKLLKSDWTFLRYREKNPFWRPHLRCDLGQSTDYVRVDDGKYSCQISAP